MRNLDECKAEIFRLGEEKIKKRKKRRMRTISVCVPLCLCLAVGSVTVLPAMLPAGMTDSNDKVGFAIQESVEAAEGTQPMKYARVEIKGVGGTEFYNEVMEPLKTNYIANLIESFCSDDADGVTGSIDDEPSYQSKPPEELSPENSASGYLISFSTDKGVKAEYSLYGYALKDEATGKTVILTESQRENLLNEIAGGV